MTAETAGVTMPAQAAGELREGRLDTGRQVRR